MSDDPTGIIKGDVKKIAAHLYSHIVKHGKFVEDGFTTAFKAHYLETFHEIAEELEKPTYSEGKRVIEIVMKEILRGVRYDRFYYRSKNQIFTVQWLAANPDILFNLHTYINQIQIIFFNIDIDLFTQFVQTICKNSTYAKIFMNVVSGILSDWIKEQYDFVDRVDFIEKTLVIIDQDKENKLTLAWDFILMVIGQETFEDDEETLSVEGFVFMNSKRLNKAKAKYFKQNAFDQMLERVGEIHDIIIDTGIVHVGVDRIIMGYL